MNRWTARNRVDNKFMAYSTGSSLSLALGKQAWHVINDSPVSLEIAFIRFNNSIQFRNVDLDQTTQQS